MFLASLVERDRPFLEAAVALHQKGEIPANSTVLDLVFKDYLVKALVGRDPDAVLGRPVAAEIPPPAMIDYYGKLHPEPGQPAAVGDTVIFGFRPQAFVTRAFIVPIAGIAAGRPQVRGIWTPAGRPADFG